MKRLIFWLVTSVLTLGWGLLFQSSALAGVATGSLSGAGQSVTLTTASSSSSTLTLIMAGSWNGSLVVEGSNDGTNYFPVFLSKYAPNTPTSPALNLTQDGTYAGSIVDMTTVRVRVITYTSGTETIFMGDGSSVFTFDGSGNLQVSVQNTVTTTISGTPSVVGAQGNGAAMSNPIGICGSGSGTGLICNIPSVCDKSASAIANNNTVSFTDFGTGASIVATSGQRIYVCGIKVVVNGTTNVSFLSSTATNCGSGTTALGATDTFSGVGQGYSWGGGMGTLFFTPQAQVLCLTSSAAFAASAWISYRQAP